MGEDCRTFISAFCKELRGFTSHLECSCASLRTAVEQKPSSLPSENLPSLLTALLNRISSANQAVERLEARTVNAISFQEILGHCKEIYKQNERSISSLEERLAAYGYIIPDKDSFAEDIAENFAEGRIDFADLGVKTSNREKEDVLSVLNNVQESLFAPSLLCRNGADGYVEPSKEHAKFDPRLRCIETLSVQDLGLSAAGLACLDLDEGSSPVVDYSAHVPAFNQKETFTVDLPSSKPLASDYEEECCPALGIAEVGMLLKPVDENEYHNSPIWMKLKVSLEDLNNFVEKVCDFFTKKKNNCHRTLQGDYVLDQDDLSSLDGGDKVKACLLFLVRLGRFRTGHANGATVYHAVRQ